MSGYDVNFDCEMAKSWKLEVDMTLMHVRRILEEVSEECEEGFDENDTVLTAIQEAGKVMHESWDKLCNGFDAINEIFGNLIKDREERIQKVADNFEQYKNTNF